MIYHGREDQNDYIPGVPIRRCFFWVAPVFGRRPKTSERHTFGVILLSFGVVFCALVSCFWLCFSTSSLRHVFGRDQKKTSNGSPGIAYYSVVDSTKITLGT